MRVLVTGAGGFLGRRTIHRLCVEGHDVFAVYRPGSSPPPVRHQLAVDLASGNLTGLPDRMDAIIHLAQSIRYREFPAAAVDMLRVNVDSSLLLLDYARQAGAEIFILASSGSVCEPYDHGMGEDVVLRPSSLYGASKAAAEMFLAAYAPSLRTLALRLWVPYGPGQRDRLIPNLIESIRAGRAVTINGERGLVCTPTHVDDIAACIADGLTRPWSGVLNVAGPETIDLMALCEMIGIRLGRVPEFLHNRAGPAPILVPDRGLIGRLWSDHVFVPLQRGIDMMASFENPELPAPSMCRH